MYGVFRSFRGVSGVWECFDTLVLFTIYIYEIEDKTCFIINRKTDWGQVSLNMKKLVDREYIYIYILLDRYLSTYVLDKEISRKQDIYKGLYTTQN